MRAPLHLALNLFQNRKTKSLVAVNPSRLRGKKKKAGQESWLWPSIVWNHVGDHGSPGSTHLALSPEAKLLIRLGPRDTYGQRPGES